MRFLSDEWLSMYLIDLIRLVFKVICPFQMVTSNIVRHNQEMGFDTKGKQQFFASAKNCCLFDHFKSPVYFSSISLLIDRKVLTLLFHMRYIASAVSTAF